MNEIKEVIKEERGFAEKFPWDYLIGASGRKVDEIVKKYSISPQMLSDLLDGALTPEQCAKLNRDIGLATAYHQAGAASILESMQYAEEEGKLSKTMSDTMRNAAIKRAGLDVVHKAIKTLREGTMPKKEQVIKDYGFDKVRWNNGTIGEIQVTNDIERGWEIFEPYGFAGLSPEGDLL